MRNSGRNLNQGNHVHLESELLSAYIDGEVTPDEAARVEQHLPTCRHCADELESLRWTVNLLREVPPIPVPRSFAVRLADLEPEPVQRRPLPRWLLNGLQWATAATALLMMLLIAADFLNLGQPALPAAFMLNTKVERAAPMVAGEAREPAAEQAEAPLVATIQTEREEVVELSSGPQEVPALTIVPEEGRTPLRLKPQPGEPLTEAYVYPAPEASAEFDAPPRVAENQSPAEGITAELPAEETVQPTPAASQSIDRLRSAEIGLTGLFIVLLGLTVWARRR